MLPSPLTAPSAAGVLEFGRLLPSLLPPHPTAAVHLPIVSVTTTPAVVGCVLAACCFPGVTVPHSPPAAPFGNIGATASPIVVPWPDHISPLIEMPAAAAHSSPL